MKDIHEVLRRKQAKYAQLGKQIEALQQAAEKLRTTTTTARFSWKSRSPTAWPQKPGRRLQVRRQSNRRLVLRAGHSYDSIVQSMIAV